MEVKGVKINVLGRGAYGVVHLLETTSHSSQLYALENGKIDSEFCEYGFRGTAVYMSPESVIGEISGALDVWSLGCIIVEMISGKLPWNYRNKIFSGESPKIIENMSSSGKDFLAMCFARDPNKRSTANMLLNHPFLLPELSIFFV
ncbi:hypothetical protein CRYUN_Cryun35bG0014000 [Craigia yunnanensis]